LSIVIVRRPSLFHNVTSVADVPPAADRPKGGPSGHQIGTLFTGRHAWSTHASVVNVNPTV
jgi:hypothetical protein